MEGASTFDIQKGAITKRVTVVVMATLLALAAAGPAFGADAADRSTSDVFDFADEQPIPGAEARMIRTDSGVGYELHTSGLEKGHAVSIWWVIFNNPEFCATDPCSVADLFVDFPTDLTPNPDVNPAVQAGGGHVIGASGKASFAGHLNEGQITNEHPAFIGGPGLTDARGAEIHLVVRSHGPVQPGLNHAMFNSFEAGCEVFLAAGIVPENPGECADQQFAVFK